MAMTERQDDFLDRIAAIEQKLRELDRRVPVSFSVSPSGVPVFEIRPSSVYSYPNGQPVPEIFMNEGTGDGIFALRATNNTGGATWEWYDRDGNQIFASDSNAGKGLARPYVPIPMNRIDSFFNGNATSFTRIWEGEAWTQHPALSFRVIDGVTSGGTVGRYRVLIDSTVVSEWTSNNVGPGVHSEHRTLLPVATAMYERRLIAIEYRRDSGAGNVYCHLSSMYGVQAPDA